MIIHFKISKAAVHMAARLTNAVVQSFQIAAVFEDAADTNAVDFSSNGELLITSSGDDSFRLFDCVNGRPKATLHSKKYGCGLVRFTHAGQTVVHASTKENDTLRYLSLHDNRYLRYFVGHKARVTSLQISPVDDTIISASEDNTVRLWDLRSTNCQGLVHTKAPATAVFDPKGLLFAIGYGGNTVKLFDVRQYERGPFLTFMPHVTGTTITDIKFNNNNKNVLVQTSSGALYLLDAFDGKLLHVLGNQRGVSDAGGDTVEACFSPCGQYVFAGTSSGHVVVWSSELGIEIATFKAQQRQTDLIVAYMSRCAFTLVAVVCAGHTDSISTLMFNPRLMMLATASASLAFWIPTVE